MIHRLTNILNPPLSTGYFPRRFKQAIIILVLKPGELPNKVENFNPISLLEIPRNVFEKINKKKLLQHPENPDYLSNGQFRFRRRRSTDIAIATCI